MGTLGQELPQSWQCLGDCIRPRDTDDIEAMRVRGRRQCSFERGRLVQKSRSA
jgi:hypothetical protein